MNTPFRIPRVLESHCQDSSELQLRGQTVGELLDDLRKRYPKLHWCVCDERGQVRQHINVFVNDDFIRVLDGLETRLEPGDIVSVFPAVSGG